MLSTTAFVCYIYLYEKSFAMMCSKNEVGLYQYCFLNISIFLNSSFSCYTSLFV